MPFRDVFTNLIDNIKEQVDRYQHGAHGRHQQEQNYAPQQPHPQNIVQAQPASPGQKPIRPPPNVYYNFSFQANTPVDNLFKHQTGGGGWGNNELQNYVSGPQNSFFTADSTLILRAVANQSAPVGQQYVSARLTSHQTTGRQRGCLYATLTPPSAPGIWPAFWLLPAEPFQWPSEGEIDILESWNNGPINHTNLHWGFFTPQDAQKHRSIETNMPDLTRPQGHEYGFAWDQPDSGVGGRMVWYIDRKAVMKADIPAGTRKMSDWQVIINIAMGGDVNQGAVPANGSYDFVVHAISMCDAPADGWDDFNNAFNAAPAGQAMAI